MYVYGNWWVTYVFRRAWFVPNPHRLFPLSTLSLFALTSTPYPNFGFPELFDHSPGFKLYTLYLLSIWTFSYSTCAYTIPSQIIIYTHTYLVIYLVPTRMAKVQRIAESACPRIPYSSLFLDQSPSPAYILILPSSNSFTTLAVKSGVCAHMNFFLGVFTNVTRWHSYWNSMTSTWLNFIPSNSSSTLPLSLKHVTGRDPSCSILA